MKKKPTRIYYAGGAVLHCDEGRLPPGAEARGVQVILQPHIEVGVESVTCGDYYVLEKGRWRAVDIFGLFDFLMDSGVVLFGRTLTRDDYAAVMKQAESDKTAWFCGERRI